MHKCLLILKMNLEKTVAEVALVKLKTLSDVYARCNVSMIELERYEEATMDNAWKRAMNAEK